MTVTNLKADILHPQYHNFLCLMTDNCNTKSKNYIYKTIEIIVLLYISLVFVCVWDFHR